MRLGRMTVGVGFWLGAGAILMAGCGDGLTTFTIEETATATVEQGSLVENLVGGLGFGGFLAMDITANQTLQNQGVTKEQINSVRMILLRLEITEPPSDQDLTFLESLSFFAEAEGLDKRRLASGGSFSDGQRSVDLALDDVELAPYATAPEMDITTAVTGHRPGHDTTILATVKLLVDVNLGGVLAGSDD